MKMYQEDSEWRDYMTSFQIGGDDCANIAKIGVRLSTESSYLIQTREERDVVRP